MMTENSVAVVSGGEDNTDGNRDGNDCDGGDDDNVFSRKTSPTPKTSSPSTTTTTTTNNQDTILFGSIPSIIVDTLNDGTDTAIVEGVSSLPLLSKTFDPVQEGRQRMTSAEAKEREKYRDDNDDKDRAAADKNDHAEVGGGVKLINILRSSYQANLDLVEIYNQRNIFTIRSLKRSRREQIVEAFLKRKRAPDDENCIGKKNDHQLEGSLKVPTKESTMGMPNDNDYDEKCHRNSSTSTTTPPETSSLRYEHPKSKHDIPTSEQLSALENEIETLRIKLRTSRQRRNNLRMFLERMVKANDTIQSVKRTFDQEAMKYKNSTSSSGGGGGDGFGGDDNDDCATTEENNKRDDSGCSDDSGIVTRLHSSVSAIIMGKGGLEQLTARGTELSQQLDEEKRVRGDQEDEDDTMDLDATQQENQDCNSNSRKRRLLTLEEEYMEDRNMVRTTTMEGMNKVVELFKKARR